MPQVTVKDCAHNDIRLRLAGRLLKMNYERVGWRLIQLWSLATTHNSTIIPLELSAEAIGRKEHDVARALTAARLAEPAVDDDHLDLSPLQTLFGDCNWLQKKRDTASAGGQVRAATAERALDGTFASDTDERARQPVRDRIVDQLATGPHTRKQLLGVLGCRKGSVLAAVRELIAENVVIDEDGLLSLVASVPGTDSAEPVPGTTWEPGPEFREPHGNRPEPGTGNREPVPGTGREPVPRNPEPEPASALAPALAPAPAHTRAREGTGNREPEPVQESNPLDGQEVVPPEQRRTVARLLWAYQNQCRAEIVPDVPGLPLNDAPGGSLDAVILRLVNHTPSQCRHALDMFKLEARHLRANDENPLQYLNGFTNWKPEPFGRRVGTTAAAVAQELRDRRARKGKSSAAQNQPPPPRRNRLN